MDILDTVIQFFFFNFETRHVPATAFKIEDALSRAPDINTGHENPADDVNAFLDVYDMAYGIVKTPENTMEAGINITK